MQKPYAAEEVAHALRSLSVGNAYQMRPTEGLLLALTRPALAELDLVTSSRAAATTLAENYVGMPLS